MPLGKGKGKGWQGLPTGPPPQKGGKAEPAPGKSGKGKGYGPHGIPEAVPAIVRSGHWVWLEGKGLGMGDHKGQGQDKGKGKGEGKGWGKDKGKSNDEGKSWQELYELAEAAAFAGLQASASNLTTGKSPGALSEALI